MPSTTKETLRLLARSARGGVVSVADAAVTLGIPGRAAANRLSRLADRGWLKRLRRGLYLVLPLEAGTNQPLAVEDPWILASRIFAPCYLGGWSAAEHWGLTEQIFRSTFVVSAARVRRRTERILGSEYHIVHVAPERVRGTTAVWRGAVRVELSDREGTIADALASPSWVGGIRHLIDIFVAYRESRGWHPEKLLSHLADLGSGAPYKRLGFILEARLPDERRLIDEALAHRTTGIVKLDPSVAMRGRLSKRWRLWANVAVPVSA